MPNWKQVQEKDPRKMLENLQNLVGGQVPPNIEPGARQNVVGGGYSVTPSLNPDAETEAAVAAQQAANVQQAGQDPGMAAKLAAFNEVIRRRNEEAQAAQYQKLRSLAGQ